MFAPIDPAWDAIAARRLLQNQTDGSEKNAEGDVLLTYVVDNIATLQELKTAALLSPEDEVVFTSQGCGDLKVSVGEDGVLVV